MRPWIGVDLDGTLAEHQPGGDVDRVGEPIAAMVERVCCWLAEGRDVRIVTARVGMTRPQAERERQIDMIHRWCREQFGVQLPVVCSKDFGMVELWDDRAVQVERNTGRTVAEAIAEWLEDGGYDRGRAIADAIRRGAWR